jgi:hypothetical protein
MDLPIVKENKAIVSSFLKSMAFHANLVYKKSVKVAIPHFLSPQEVTH